MARKIQPDEDEAQIASRALSRVIAISGDSDEDEKPSQSIGKNPAARALGQAGGRKGGRKGGAARAAKLSPERRQEIARKAAAARWGKKAPDE